MRCEFFSDAGGFLDVAAGFLAESEAENTVLIGAALRRRSRPKSDAVMIVARDGDAVRLAAMMTPPYALVLSAGDPEAIPCLVEALSAAAIRPSGVSGLEPMARRFAALWRRRERAAAESETRTILYHADRIAPIRNVPGELRTAAPDDVDWLATWQRRFAEQVGLSAAERMADMRAISAVRISRGEMVYWAVEGRPVSSAAFVPSTPAGDAGRVNAVFTLEEERGNGYASACVAALSRRLLDRGWRYCLIFADRGNPTTTRIYPRLGYREIAGFATIGFRYPG
jgi:predicted GNAT family acetyltransferase